MFRVAFPIRASSPFKLKVNKPTTLVYTTSQLSCTTSQRNYTTSPLPAGPPRAIVYTKNGAPQDVLQCRTLPSLALPTEPPPGTLNIRFLLSPINPADLNVIEGVYPSKPALMKPEETGLTEDVFIGGNEGLAQVLDVGSGVQGFEKGDWVVMVRQQMGTWIGWKNVRAEDVLVVPRTKTGKDSITEAQAAMMTVNLPTAYGMLTGFVKLQEGDWIVQNGANSAVGQAVIQIASHLGYKTINFIRPRPDALHTLEMLGSLGATHAFTYNDLWDRRLDLRRKVKEWTGGRGPLLGLNCIGGKDTSLMAFLLGKDAHLVSYGAMSKQPLSLATSLHIFKNLTSHGYWQTRWYETHSLEERNTMMRTLMDLMEDDKLKAPPHEVIPLTDHNSEEAIGDEVRSIVKRLNEGRLGRKMLLKFEDT